MVVRGILAAALTLSLALGGLGQVGILPDPRIQKTLDELAWKYKTDNDGDYSFIMETDNNRTQLLIVRSRTFSTGKLEQREIWSAGALVDGDVSLETARMLLSDNLQVKLGCWCTIPQDEDKKRLVMYVARIPAECDKETFAEYCQGVAEVADALEQQLEPGKDQY